MVIKRGCPYTTTLSVRSDNVLGVRVHIFENNRVVINKHIAETPISESQIAVNLSAEDTAKLTAGKDVWYRISVELPYGRISQTKKYRVEEAL